MFTADIKVITYVFVVIYRLWCRVYDVDLFRTWIEHIPGCYRPRIINQSATPILTISTGRRKWRHAFIKWRVIWWRGVTGHVTRYKWTSSRTMATLGVRLPPLTSCIRHGYRGGRSYVTVSWLEETRLKTWSASGSELRNRKHQQLLYINVYI